MAQLKTQMKAPPNVRGEANIEGHQYNIPKSGVIDVVSENHIPTLRRHGFIEYSDPKAAQKWIDETEDKDALVTFIAEHGGEDADNSMGLKKLKRLAREAIVDEE